MSSDPPRPDPEQKQRIRERIWQQILPSDGSKG